MSVLTVVVSWLQLGKVKGFVQYMAAFSAVKQCIDDCSETGAADQRLDLANDVFNRLTMAPSDRDLAAAQKSAERCAEHLSQALQAVEALKQLSETRGFTDEQKVRDTSSCRSACILGVKERRYICSSSV